MSFLRLIRFEDIDGNKLYGDPQIESVDDLSRLLENGELFARVLDGSSPFNLASKAGALRQGRCSGICGGIRGIQRCVSKDLAARS